MFRPRSAIAICVALLAIAVAPAADAQPQIIERVRVQGGYITEARPAPTPRLEDYWIGAVPEISALWVRGRWVANLTYQLTGALHTFGAASEVANRALFTSAYEVTRRTSLILGAEAAQTTVSNFLIQRPAADTPIVLYPAVGTRFLTGRVNQALRYEVSPVVIATQDSAVSLVTTLAPAPPLDTISTSAGLAVERIWRSDALGMTLRGSHLVTRATFPTPSAEIFTVTAAPSWRHDWSRQLTSSLSAGASYLFSPDPGTRPVVAPYGQATALYTIDPTVIDATVRVGVFPSLLTGQTLQSRQLIVHALTPLSTHHRVMLGSSIGYLRGELIDLRATTNDQSFSTLSADVDVTWQATGHAQVFGRYLFITQIGDATTAASINSSFMRDAVIIGVQFSSENLIVRVPTGFAQRVDGADAPFRPEVPPAETGGGQGQQQQGAGNIDIGGDDEDRRREPGPDDETSASGGNANETTPGMWRTRPTRPVPAPTSPGQQQPPQQQQQQRRQQPPRR